MKHNYKLIIIALAGIVLTYAGCSKLKDDGTANTSTVSTKVVNTQLATTLSEALYGSEGGFSISDGLDYPTNIDFKVKGKAKIQSISNFGCGFKIDTTFSASLGDSDTSKLNIWEKINYQVACTSNKISSVSIADSLNLTIVGGGSNITEKYGKNFLLKSLNPGVSNTKLQLDGKLNLSVNGSYKEGTATKAISATFSFNLSTLVIDRTADADIISGNATFSSKGTYDKGTWNYTGTIKFIGSHKATVTINGDVYTINVKTGQVL
ncbi:hypothetical protein [Mucilaginibacter sp. FT3.2]|uniref:hypothetical protein n=1 Tax=Mucilaginibacter sp. FT3.2 TaxID=2723090 RepID=UPI001607A414|nr:hypothetical protein [Mucilaginibacter sp. FT3.2]MBB6231775.1 hypothetical protein [Mucilaginibacter sp. FT3.2]